MLRLPRAHAPLVKRSADVKRRRSKVTGSSSPTSPNSSYFWTFIGCFVIWIFVAFWRRNLSARMRSLHKIHQIKFIQLLFKMNSIQSDSSDWLVVGNSLWNIHHQIEEIEDLWILTFEFLTFVLRFLSTFENFCGFLWIVVDFWRYLEDSLRVCENSCQFLTISLRFFENCCQILRKFCGFLRFCDDFDRIFDKCRGFFEDVWGFSEDFLSNLENTWRIFEVFWWFWQDF